MSKKTIGTIHDPKSLFMRVHVGEANCGKSEYGVAILNGCEPIVHSKQTGKWFTLSWSDIVAMAVAAGIDTK